jgi:hypothetical protein
LELDLLQQAVQAHVEPAALRRNMQAGGERNEKIHYGRLVFTLEEHVSQCLARADGRDGSSVQKKCGCESLLESVLLAVAHRKFLIIPNKS